MLGISTIRSLDSVVQRYFQAHGSPEERLFPEAEFINNINKATATFLKPMIKALDSRVVQDAVESVSKKHHWLLGDIIS